MVAHEEPERKSSEEERFESDYYAYFEQPENSTRYTKIRQQQTLPDWFVSDSNTDYSSKFSGTYVATWTFIATSS